MNGTCKRITAGIPKATVAEAVLAKVVDVKVVSVKFVYINFVFIRFVITNMMVRYLCIAALSGFLLACSSEGGEGIIGGGIDTNGGLIDGSESPPVTNGTNTTGTIPGTVTTVNSVNVPALADDSFLIGTEILGTMIRYQPGSGAASRFSDLRITGSFAEFSEAVDVANNSIVTVSDDNALNVLDIDTGDFLWDVPLGVFQDTSINNPTAPVCAQNICYAMGSGGDLVAIDLNTRETVWSTDLFPSEDNFIDVFPLLVTTEKIFAGGFRYSTVYGDVAPRLYVMSRATGEFEKALPDGLAVIAGDLLLIAGAGLHAYDFDTLEPVWHLERDYVSRPTVVGDVVVVHSADPTVAENIGQRVLGINRLDGTVIWTRKAGTMASFFTPTTDGRLIYTGFGENCINHPCDSGYPMALNPADGSIIWTNQDADVAQTRPPVVVAGRLLYDDVSAFRDAGGGFAYERGVASLDASNGAIQWISLGGHSFYSLSAISNGTAIRSSANPTFVSDR